MQTRACACRTPFVCLSFVGCEGSVSNATFQTPHFRIRCANNLRVPVFHPVTECSVHNINWPTSHAIVKPNSASHSPSIALEGNFPVIPNVDQVYQLRYRLNDCWVMLTILSPPPSHNSQTHEMRNGGWDISELT